MSERNQEISIFESRAKLMVSGEYFVLKGALSLALPLKYGQKLTVRESGGEPVVYWVSLMKGKPWFSAVIKLPNFEVTDTDSPGISATLCRILGAAHELNPGFPAFNREYRVTSEMDFDPSWGIGSGSSLVSNIAWWAGCDPFALNSRIFKGSGYDIACARSSRPIIYQANGQQSSCREADFHPRFHRNLYFVYQGRKQNTLESIRDLDLATVSPRDAEEISALTLGMEKAADLRDFQALMDRHEEIVGRFLGKTPAGEALFGDFSGSVKSLGAWGGDFVLVATDHSEEYVRNHFTKRNLTTIIPYREMVPEAEFTMHLQYDQV